MLRPEDALEIYYEAREGEVSKKTLQGYRYRLKHFLRWCEIEDIEDMNDLDGRKLQEYKIWRRRDGDLKKSPSMVSWML